LGCLFRTVSAVKKKRDDFGTVSTRLGKVFITSTLGIYKL
jgi:hypothetical protein